jgi:hypothetical protein
VSGPQHGAAAADKKIPELRLEKDVDCLKDVYTLEVPLDEVYGSLHETSLTRSEWYNDLLDDVMDEMDSHVDDLYCGWS